MSMNVNRAAGNAGLVGWDVPPAVHHETFVDGKPVQDQSVGSELARPLFESSERLVARALALAFGLCRDNGNLLERRRGRVIHANLFGRHRRPNCAGDNLAASGTTGENESSERCDDELVHFGDGVVRPNDPSSATRPAGRVDCNREVMAGFAAAHG